MSDYVPLSQLMHYVQCALKPSYINDRHAAVRAYMNAEADKMFTVCYEGDDGDRYAEMTKADEQTNLDKCLVLVCSTAVACTSMYLIAVTVQRLP